MTLGTFPRICVFWLLRDLESLEAKDHARNLLEQVILSGKSLQKKVIEEEEISEERLSL